MWYMSSFIGCGYFLNTVEGILLNHQQQEGAVSIYNE